MAALTAAAAARAIGVKRILKVVGVALLLLVAFVGTAIGLPVAAAIAATQSVAQPGPSEPGPGVGPGGELVPSDQGWWRPAAGTITAEYGPRAPICSGGICTGGFHKGMDFGGNCGSPIVATYAGTVVSAGPSGAYGNRIVIDHGGGITTAYSHLLGGSTTAEIGAQLEGGTHIADMGNTGISTGCHLDFEVRIDNVLTDPAPFLRDRGVTV